MLFTFVDIAKGAPPQLVENFGVVGVNASVVVNLLKDCSSAGRIAIRFGVQTTVTPAQQPTNYQLYPAPILMLKAQ
ncbi:MAG TPA: hypothetical protein IGR15_07125 [Synechococcus sp. M44_DOE_062]|nr:hypothetical protein [Synechococcus sp. M44_DOE_062]